MSIAAEALDGNSGLTESHHVAVVAAYDSEVMVALRAMEDGAGAVGQIELSEDLRRSNICRRRNCATVMSKDASHGLVT